jgi:hypothetical protein
MTPTTKERPSTSVLDGPIKRHAAAQLSDRAFGLTLTCAAMVFSLTPLIRGRAPRSWLWAVAIPLALLAFLLPRALNRPKILWLAITKVLGRIINFIALSAIFFLVMTPVALLFRAIGRDVLGRRFNPRSVSYWEPRDKGSSPSQQFPYQF